MGDLWPCYDRLGSRRLSELRPLLVCLVLLAPRALVVAAQPTFTATLDRDSVVVGESVTLTLKFEGGSPKARPGIPQVPGLAVAGGVSTSVNSTVADGVMTSTTSYSVPLVPQQAGEFVIPSIAAEVEGQRLQSQPLRIKVLQSDPTAPPAEFAEKLAFPWLVLPKREMYLGDVLVAELRLYIRNGVHNISDVQLPPLGGEGFAASQRVEGQRFQRLVGNTPFTVIPLLTALTPVKTGAFGLGPTNGSLIAYLSTGRFDFFGRPETAPRQVTFAAEQQTLRVLPLPAESVPAGFNGAVGNYTMSFSAGPTNVAAGDPITVKVLISGQGRLDSLALPDQPAWRDFKTYPATSEIKSTDAFGVQGTKTFEQVIVPQSADIKELPPISFSFFDPNAKSYRTLTQPAVKLVVRPSTSAAAPTVVATGRGTQDNPPPKEDIVPNKQRLGTVGQLGPPLVQYPWFLALQGVPVLAWVSALLWRKRADQLANNPRLRRQRLVGIIIRNGLVQLRQLAAAQKSDEFFAALFRLLQEQLGERLDLPASAITEAVIEEQLRPRRVPETTLAPLHELFQTCNLARYSPIKSSQELAAVIPKLESALNELQKLKL